MKIGDRCFVHGYIDEIRKDTVIIKNKGGYFGTDPGEVIVVNDTAHPNWIPVSERLPEEDGTYIVCLEDGSVFEYGYITNWYDDAWEYCKKDIVAWMPRPEPYREET